MALLPVISTLLCVLPFFVGISGNFLVLYMVKKLTKPRTAADVLIANLALIDLVICIVSPPVLLMLTWLPGDLHLVKTALSNFNGTVYIVNLHVNCLLLSTIAAQRCWKSVNPLKEISVKKTAVLCGFIWTEGLLVSTGALIHWKNPNTKSIGTLSTLVHYQMCIMLTIVSVIMTLCYVRMMISFRKATRVVPIMGLPFENLISIKSRHLQRSIKMCVVLVICYLLSVVPTLVMANLAHNMDLPRYRKRDLLILAMTTTMFQNYINPFVYCLCSQRFRTKLMKIIGTKVKLNQQTVMMRRDSLG